jgi:hypothetical protein
MGAYYCNRSLERAILEYRQAIDLSPDVPVHHSDLACALVSLHDAGRTPDGWSDKKLYQEIISELSTAREQPPGIRTLP